jgi:outer membrane protein TolC
MSPRAPGRATSSTRLRAACLVSAVVTLAVLSTGCTGLGRWACQGFKVGPEYLRPPAPIADEWIDFENPDVLSDPADYSCWWEVFGDPMLNQLVARASQQNLTLQTAGMRILEARARLGIARGSLFPQVQQAYGDFTRINNSSSTANILPVADHDNWGTGFNASWELDFWGRYRRLIESQDALLNAEIENYDNVLVILQAEVAAAYIQFRTLQERLELAKQNVQLQQRTLQIVNVQFRHGKVTELYVAQAK